MGKLRVLVTGGSRGMGKAIADAFEEDEEYIVNRPGSERDVRANETWHSKPLRCDILINNAGVHDDDLVENMADLAWQKVIDTNLTGTFKGTRAAIPYMKEQRWGRIINISSVMAKHPARGCANYVASKAAIEAFTLATAKEVAPYGITVNAIAPGYLDVGMAKDLKLSQHDLSAIPMKRLGKAYEVANLCLFLASHKAEYITGQTIGINGGMA